MPCGLAEEPCQGSNGGVTWAALGDPAPPSETSGPAMCQQNSWEVLSYRVEQGLHEKCCAKFRTADFEL